MSSQSLVKFLVSATRYSRRELATFIIEGKVSINNKVCTSISEPINTEDDKIKVLNESIKKPRLVVYKFYKPKDVITTFDDPKGRKSLEYFFNPLKEAVFSVGRLDRLTVGLLLVTNDGDLANRILHPSFVINKTYNVTLDKPLTKNDYAHLMTGFFLDDGPVSVVSLEQIDIAQYVITITEGRNRLIRRSFEFFGYKVNHLKRTRIGQIELGKMGVGEIKDLSNRESNWLQSL